jgi:thiol-disulfide isomerase/thioredoxin
MAKSRIGVRLLAVVILSIGFNLAQAPAAAPTPAQMLQFKPRQQGVNVGTPSDAEVAGCKVELVTGAKVANGKTASGWLLKDPQGRPLRRFFDSNGDNQIDIWSYYLNGEECYREVDSNFNGKADQYRWLGSNGSKWGVDLNEDGVIDGWKMISPEEVSQEVLAAVMGRDFPRFQALVITKAELDSLELPDVEANRIKNKTRGAATTFQATVDALAKVAPGSKWIHLALAAPECIPADALGAKADMVHYKHGTILYGDEKTQDFLQTGEMVLVGRAWRLVEAPTTGSNTPNPQTVAGSAVNISDNIKPLIDELKKVDEKYVGAKTPAESTEYNLARAAVLEKIVAAVTVKERDDWIKQVADCYGTAAQNGAKAALAKLTELKASVVKTAPGGNIAAYVEYREMSAEYALITSDPTLKSSELPKLQESWKDRLAKFVQAYPAAEDTPDAIMQLGMVAEFIGKELEAKNWYDMLKKGFPTNSMAEKAAGAVRRLGSEGQPFELKSLTLGTKAPFTVNSLKGKAVVVYYWASWNNQCVADFARMKTIMTTYAPKGVELVCVNLDNSDVEATKFLQANPMTGTHLHEPHGLDSPPAVQYGIMVLPSMFIVDAEGKVINRNAQVATMEDDLKRIVK